MELKISDLPPQFENIAIELGIDKVKALFKEFGGGYSVMKSWPT